MEFSGAFELEDTTVEEVWLALSDPVLVADSLSGCQYLLAADGDVDFDELSEEAETRDWELSGNPDIIAERPFREGQQYAALMRVSVGPVNPTFETVVTIVERNQPRMRAEGEGNSGDSSFEMSSGMEFTETDGGVEVQWETEADVFGKVAAEGLDTDPLMSDLQASAEFREQLLEVYTKRALEKTSERVGTPAAAD